MGLPIQPRKDLCFDPEEILSTTPPHTPLTRAEQQAAFALGWSDSIRRQQETARRSVDSMPSSDESISPPMSPR